jgi:hypothetical protein
VLNETGQVTHRSQVRSLEEMLGILKKLPDRFECWPLPNSFAIQRLRGALVRRKKIVSHASDLESVGRKPARRQALLGSLRASDPVVPAGSPGVRGARRAAVLYKEIIR